MAKLENYVELARQTAREISADGETWRSFLQTASTLYKYSFYDQMMIYAQRPDATACASFELWRFLPIAGLRDNSKKSPCRKQWITGRSIRTSCATSLTDRF